MSKKVTIEEIANLAGVSITTVSFVLNNREDQKISEETKKKVWQIVNLLGYRPSSFAKNIRKSKEKKLIAVYTSFVSDPLQKAIMADFLENVVRSFSPLHYEVILLSDQSEKIDIADAVVTFGLTKEDFRRFGENNFIPLIAVDSLINDPVFFQINSDYENLNSLAEKYFSAPFTFVDVRHSDLLLNDEIRNSFQNTAFVNNMNELSKIDCPNLAVNNQVLFDLLSANRNVFFRKDLQEKKYSQIVQCTQFALSHEEYDIHNFKI